MWQRFSERARKTIFYAQEEAQRFGEGYVSTEHILLGLLREPESVAARVFKHLGISLSKVQIEVEQQLPRGDARPSQDMTLTPRAKRVIDLAFDEARNLGNNWIGTEHLLLGLIREGDGVAGRILAKLGATLEIARRVVIEIQHPATQGAPPAYKKPVASMFGWPKLHAVPDQGDQEQARYLSPASTQLLDIAWEECVSRKHGYVTPLYILLAIAITDTLAADVIEALGVDPDVLAEMVSSELVEGQAPPSLPPVLSPRAATLLAHAFPTARVMNSALIEPEHMLIAMLTDTDSFAARLLMTLGLTLESVGDKATELAARLSSESDSE